jgi:hypothetical protein
MTKIAELFGLPTVAPPPQGWAAVVAAQACPFLNRKCLKIRKSDPTQTIGTCTLRQGKIGEPVMICPHRLLERRQIFHDCFHLLTRHEPGNELHLVSELAVPGGSVDYCLVSVRGQKVVDFVGIELQTLDTTGSAWPERQQLLRSAGVKLSGKAPPGGGLGMNWKMTAKTTLVQLHHKVETFEHIGRHLVLVLQDVLMDYMRQAFTFDHLVPAKLGDPQQFHCYQLLPDGQTLRLQLKERWSTDTAGIAKCLGLKTQARVELDQIVRQIEGKLSPRSLLTLDPTRQLHLPLSNHPE